MIVLGAEGASGDDPRLLIESCTLNHTGLALSALQIPHHDLGSHPGQVRIASVVRHAVQPFLVRLDWSQRWLWLPPGRQVARGSPSVRKGLRQDNDETLTSGQISPGREKIPSNPAAEWAIVTKSD